MLTSVKNPANQVGLVIGPVRTWRETLPYGTWKTQAGFRIIFDRHYKPMFRRSPLGVTTAVQPYWVQAIVKETWFYNDSNAPWLGCELRHQGALERVFAALREFEIPVMFTDKTPAWARACYGRSIEILQVVK